MNVVNEKALKIKQFNKKNAYLTNQQMDRVLIHIIYWRKINKITKRYFAWIIFCCSLIFIA